MELSYRQLETTLVAHLSINPDRVPTFRSRIKQLQRLEFPSGVNVGRGTKMIYTGTHLFKLATAFELIGAGLPAQLATGLVERHWAQIAAGYSWALRCRLFYGSAHNVFARFIVRTMHDMQNLPKDAPEPDHVAVEDGEHLAVMMASNRDRLAYCYPTLCLSDIYRRVTDYARTIGGVHAANFDKEIIHWIASAQDLRSQKRGTGILIAGEYKNVRPNSARSFLSKYYEDGEVAEILQYCAQIGDDDVRS